MLQAESSIISLFPLANVVLFPSLTAPLFIFEPRYRQMVEQSLADSGLIGMVAVRPGGADSMRGDPSLFAIGCAGEIIRSRRRDDGTWDILLRATNRFRIVEEIVRPEGQLYRSARVEALDEACDDADPTATARLRKHVLTQLAELMQREHPDRSSQPYIEQLDRIVDDDHLADALAQGIGFAVLEKQRLLEATGAANRYHALSELIRFRLAERGAHSGPGSGVLQ